MLTFPWPKNRNIMGRYLDLLRARDRDNIFALGQKPSQCNLARRCVVFFAKFLETLHKLQDIWEVLWPKASMSMKLSAYVFCTRTPSNVPGNGLPEVVVRKILMGFLNDYDKVRFYLEEVEIYSHKHRLAAPCRVGNMRR